VRALALLALVVSLANAAPLPGQAFTPPPVKRASPRGTRIGLYGFGIRSGLDANGGGQAVLGATLDAGNLFVSRLRVRPSAEVGMLNGANTYAGSLEFLYRFLDDDRAAAPYLGGGLSVAGHTDCGADPGCPGLWVNVVLGIEIRVRSTFNWLIEYHAMDAFKHNRLYLGLTTRRGN
jgi:hypothetical protein